ncbi:mRNA export protein [Sparassis crispa]|uniref:mRNA export protein n=1 Tax=Sparassis crispa TaxID=139825 RepID=A0A401H2P8_9APHY|nr:mRNA export protein [Sparassis crispa]GBE88707.1 mRNA export protein [Sparassis crispa]
MDKTLDEIISSHPKGIRRSSSRRINTGKSQILGSPASAPVTRARAAAAATNGAKGATAAPTAQQPADKIIVSNLPPDVNEAQVKELFHTMIGPLREVTLHYDAQGRSKGVAAVQFQRRGDGTKAYNQYNNRLIDGKRPMKIEIVLDPSRPTPPASLASRVAPAPAAAAPTEGARTGGTRPRRGRGGGGGGRGRKNERPAKSAADLDAEMEDYTASNATAAA